MQGGKIKRATTVSLVVEELRRRIAAGELPDGSQIRQETIANELGVSRIPVREALRQLEAEGFVTLESHKGAVVSRLSIEEITELFELRVRIETWLLALAIPKMTAADLESARAALAAMTSNGRIENWGVLNWQFHEALYRPSGRPLSIKLVKRIHDNVDRYVRLQITLTAGQMKAHREHKQLLELCQAHSIADATRLLEQHILDAQKGLTGQLARLRRHEERQREDGKRANGRSRAAGS